jgi:hypothetical protein
MHPIPGLLGHPMCRQTHKLDGTRNGTRREVSRRSQRQCELADDTGTRDRSYPHTATSRCRDNHLPATSRTPSLSRTVDTPFGSWQGPHDWPVQQRVQGGDA